MGRRRYLRTTMSLALAGALFMAGAAMAAEKPETDLATYMIEGSPTKVVNYYYDYEGAETLSGETLFTYDGDGNVLEEISRYADLGVLFNSSRITYEYNAEGLETLATEYYWDVNATEWAPSSRETYTYTDGVLMEVLSEMTDGTMWAPTSRTVNTYVDASTMQTIYYGHDGTDWYPNMKYTMTINANGDPTLVLSGSYYEGVYTENWREEYDYNPDGSLAVGTYSNRASDADPWEVHTTSTYTYDSEGRMTSELMMLSDWDTGELREHELTNYSYDDEGRMDEELMYMHETPDSPWTPSDRSVYVYNGDTAVEESPAPVTFELYQNSPNPFNPATTIIFTLAEAGTVTLDVYNTAGQKVVTLVDGTMDAGHHQAVWDARGFATGTYITRLTVDGLTRTGKMLLVK